MDESLHVLQELHFVDHCPVLVLLSAWFKSMIFCSFKHSKWNDRVKNSMIWKKPVVLLRIRRDGIPGGAVFQCLSLQAKREEFYTEKKKSSEAGLQCIFEQKQSSY